MYKKEDKHLFELTLIELENDKLNPSFSNTRLPEYEAAGPKS